MKCAIPCVTTSSVPMSDANVSLLIPEALHKVLDKLQVTVRYSI